MKIISLIISIVCFLACLCVCIWAFYTGGNLIPFGIVTGLINFGLIVPIVHDIKRLRNK